MSLVALAGIAVEALGWGLVHFVWQALVVGVVYAVVRALLPRGDARYAAALLALLVLAAAPAWTIWREAYGLAQTADAGAIVVGAHGVAVLPAGSPVAFDWAAAQRVVLPWLVLAWACGVGWLGARAIGQWRRLRGLVAGAGELPVWQARARLLGARLGLRRAVDVVASARIATPALVGWVRPVVVMPLAVLTRMPAEQVLLVLAHELAHLRRCDHLANLFQLVLETLFFYHPVVHWISRDARNERELCCDALALRASGGRRRDFVAALAELAELQGEQTGLVLAASGGVLVERAWFIAGAPVERGRVRIVLAAALFAAVVLGGVLLVARSRSADLARGNAIVMMNTGVLRSGVAAGIVHVPAVRLRGVERLVPTLAPIAPVRSEASTGRARMTPIGITVPELDEVPLAASAPVLLRVAPVTIHHAAIRPADPQASATPRPQRAVAPVYPTQALLNGTQGQVEVEFSVDATGTPRDLRVVYSTAAGMFDSAALEALARWRFGPGLVHGARYRETFAFRLGQAATRAAPGDAACVVRTGTHICRPVNAAMREAAPARVDRAATAAGVSR